jgi:hypothetical protein
MLSARTASLVIRITAATLWASVLSVTGLWAMLSASREWPMFGPAWIVAGVAGVAAGLFVFMVLVADRLVPSASRRLVVTVELAVMVSFVLCLVGTVLLVRSGAGW